MRISDLSSDGCSSDLWNRRFDEVGLTETHNKRTTSRSWLGARGDAWGDWKWEATFGYGDFTQDQVRLNEINLFALEKGIQTEFVPGSRSEEHTSELQSLMRISYAVFCLKKTITTN